MAEHYDLVKSGSPFSVLYSIDENEWNGKRTLQLNIKDIKPGVDGLLVSEGTEEAAAMQGT